ncbi:SapC family protein [Sphingomonas cavernae]|uniref:Multidrug transporter n=1 Tax=Sphingomonas cavernae TaxID=2320861 RepID=A0A418WLI2_9SPHN|nr:SapC family protein [Sphingomonas cavernae]RJF90855.1 multidrug transporter [Sphingomonas cavernae]
MASAPQANNLPLLFKELVPLSTNEHKDWKARNVENAPWIVGQHAVPIAIDEFVHAQRFYPIVFSTGEEPVPLALMGLNEGVNMFVDDEGKLIDRPYVPAYIRRYPFMLARLRPDTDDLSLCFDPTAGVIGEFDEGAPLFENGEMGEPVKSVLGFCEQWEQSWQRTQAFMQEVKEAKLLIDGEVAIQPPGADKPFIYRGFQMVAEEKLREMRGDQARKLLGNGVLPLLYAHIFSLSLMSELFQKQMAAGKVPVQPVA